MADRGFCHCGKPRRAKHCDQCIDAWLRWLWADPADPLLFGRRASEWRQIEQAAACPFCLEPMSLHPAGPRTDQTCGEAIRRAAGGTQND